MAETNNHPPLDGNALVALSLRRAGVDRMFGVVGIPVTALATRAVTLGVRFLAFHNEQSAGYAASAYGYLTGRPGILLTVSGPGCVHGLAGVSNAAVNAWPMIMISGSCDQGYFGRGDFQELDQVEAVKPFSKLSVRVRDIKEVPRCVFEVIRKAASGQPGGCYLDLPTDVLHQTVSEAEAEELLVEAEKGVEKEMDPTFADQLAEEWSRLQDYLENTVGSDFSFRDPYVPTEFPIMYAQYQQLMANLPNQREVYSAHHPSPWRRANLEREIRDILKSIPGFDIRREPYYSHYRDMDNQSPIPTPDQNPNPPNIQEEDGMAQLTTEVENLRAFMTATPGFPMEDDYLAGMFPTFYRMRQAHQKIATLCNAITRSTVDEHEIRRMLAYILGVDMGIREEDPEEDEDPEEPPEEADDPEEPPEEDEDPEEPLEE